MMHLHRGAPSLPFHAKLFKAPAIFQSGNIRAAQMELLGEIERQLLRTLRFDNSFVLLEDAPVLCVELFVGLDVAIVAAGQPIKFGVVIRHWGAKVDIGMALDTSRLAALDDYHKRQDDRIQLFRRAVRTKFIDRRIDLVLEAALGLGERDRGRLGLIGIAEDASVNPWEVGEVGEVFDHARCVGAPLAFRSVRRPVKARIAELGWKVGNMLTRFVETNPNQAVAFLDTKRFCARLGGDLAIRRKRRNTRATAVYGVVPTVIGTHEMIAAQPTE